MKKRRKTQNNRYQKNWQISLSRTPVGMTILLRGPRLFRRIYSGLYRVVIPTVA
jgi:hypothetical protein